MQDISTGEWASAIAERISDEWDGKNEFPEDARLLKDIIEKLLFENPSDCMKFVGTGIIEEDYFDQLS